MKPQSTFSLTLGNKLFFMVALMLISLSSCEDKIESELRFEAYTPIYLSQAELEASVKKVAVQPLKNPGKIYTKGNYIFINEPSKGVHVIDNLKPTEPKFISFIEIPGNYDISIQNNLLYADNATDLVVLNIADIENPIEVSRVKGVFKEVFPEGSESYTELDPNKGVITGWKLEEVVQKISPNNSPIYYRGDDMITLSEADFSASNMAIPQPMNQTGKSGSLARFKIYKNSLYTLERNELHVFNISKPTDPVGQQSIEISWLAETLFIRGQELFVGTRSGMQVYSLVEPNAPAFISEIDHWRACDPVVVSGDYAYVTLRSGTNCGGVDNELQVISIENIEAPTLKQTVKMTSPYGLGISNNTLFVCDGHAGLKIYDATLPLQIGSHLIRQFPEIHAVDVIPLNDNLLLIGEDGLRQYDFSDLNNITLLSHIQIQ